MRLIALLFTATLVCSAASAQTPKASSTSSSLSSDADAKAVADRDLPVSLGKIRDALARATAPGVLLKNVQDTPTFRLEIRERQKIEELLATLEFKGGPSPPGGPYGYEQQRIMFPAVDNPLAQPYAAFDQTQLLVVGAESAVSSLLGKSVAKALREAYRTNQLEAARAEVERAIVAYCATKENGGAGIQICEPPATPAR
jgi:hypothetical protein